MKKLCGNNLGRVTLVLNISMLVGIARDIMSKAVHEQLIQLGYTLPKQSVWQRNFGYILVNYDEPVQELDYSCGDYVNSMHGNPRDVYDATTELDAFLEAAKNALVIKRQIEGVDVAITRNGIDLNPTALLQNVSEQARKIQSEVFRS